MLQARVLELDEASETVRSESVSTGPERDSRSREKTAPAPSPPRTSTPFTRVNSNTGILVTYSRKDEVHVPHSSVPMKMRKFIRWWVEW